MEARFELVRHQKSMIAFEIYVNGKKRFTAGGDYPQLTTTLMLIHTKLPKPNDASILFSTNGIKADERVKVGSWPADELSVGDRVEIRIVEVSEVDAPKSVGDHGPAKDIAGA